MPATQSSLAAFESSVVATATVWTAFIRFSPTDKRRTDHPDEASALATARIGAESHQKPILIYASNPEGRCVFVGSVHPGGDYRRSIPVA